MTTFCYCCRVLGILFLNGQLFLDEWDCHSNWSDCNEVSWELYVTNHYQSIIYVGASSHFKRNEIITEFSLLFMKICFTKGKILTNIGMVWCNCVRYSIPRRLFCVRNATNNNIITCFFLIRY